MGVDSSIDGSSSSARTITVCGLDGAGKSEIVCRLRSNAETPYIPIPTAGAQVYSMIVNSLPVKVYDMGGNAMYRDMWETFIQSSDGVVFVIDKSDKERMFRARQELEPIINTCAEMDIPLLIMANKADIESTLKVSDIEQISGALESKIVWTCQECSAKTGEGLISGFDWLIKSMPMKRRN